jgi:hypothetical protein
LTLRFVHPTYRVALAVAFVLLPARTLSAQDQCQCTAPGAESSRIASAIGGGLFAGLIAAVIPFRHAAGLASTPAGAGADSSALTQHADSSDIAPEGSPARSVAAVTGGAPTGGAPMGPGASGRAEPLMRVAAAPLPSMTPTEATAEGMIAPRTATMLPALAMIGVGAVLMGIFFLRVRNPSRHY